MIKGEEDSEKLYNLLRNIENSNPYCEKYLRFKKHNDASIIILKV